jgi:cytochrome c peroxidase
MLNTQILRQIDDTASVYQQRKQVQADEERRLFQRISQNFEATEKQLTSFQSSYDKWLKNQLSRKTELKTAFSNIDSKSESLRKR